MTKRIRFRNADDTEVFVEVNIPEQDGLRPAGRGNDVAVLAQATFEAALQKLRPLTDTVMSTLRELNNPDEITIEFGITLNAETGVVIASASAEANFSVALKWSNPSSKTAIAAG